MTGLEDSSCLFVVVVVDWISLAFEGVEEGGGGVIDRP